MSCNDEIIEDEPCLKGKEHNVQKGRVKTNDDVWDSKHTDQLESNDTPCGNGSVVERSLAEDTVKNVSTEQVEYSTEQSYSTSAGVATLSLLSTTAKRVWDKKFFCTFCKTWQAKLPRHLERKHANEMEVAQFLCLPKCSVQRKEKMAAISNRGLFQHNVQVFKTGSGVLVPKRRPNKPTEVTKYLPCEVCGAFYVKKYLVRHQAKCRKKINAKKRSVRDRTAQARSSLLIPTNKETSSRFKEHILSRMTHDDVFQEISSDNLIQSFGEYLFEKLCHMERHHRMVADRCRELGRFMKKVKEIDPSVKNITELIMPGKYQLIKKAVQFLAGFDFETNTFAIPTLALKLGHSLKKCACILKGTFMEDDVLRQRIGEVNNFLELIELKWTTEIATKAHRTLEERKWNAPRRLPLAKDIVVLNKFLLEEDARLSSQLVKQTTANTFEQLTEVSLCRTLVLNRRRVGEVQYMLVKDYKQISRLDPESDTFKTLTESEKALTQKLKRIEIRGKKGRKVPVILTKDMQSSINLLLSSREACGVSKNNKYLFPSLRHESGHYRAHVVLRKMAIASGAQNPTTLTSTKLRKHVATMTQLLNLRTHELDAVAAFMGHDIRVHRQYYRLQDDALDLAKVSKLLINLDKGKLSSMKDKNLDDMTVASDESLSEDDDVDMLDKGEVLENENFPRNEPPIIPSTSVDDDTATIPSAFVDVCSPQVPKKTVSLSKFNVDNKRAGMKKPTRSIKPRPWSTEELKCVREYFKGFIHLKTIPRKDDVMKFLSCHGSQLNKRSWPDVKWCVRNSFNKTK
ncbi:uncharacterized protein LOC134531559 [Bacillus rossius redtenbacheri]|uniref:uncharacterized protein LOC134531559 n=1 Tax=Bacillus rossius redtenbacheri TaxID=93214 RepID=UPI002FDE7700